MNNTLTVTTVNGCVCTEIVTSDGVTTMEIHQQGLHDSKVLSRLFEKKFYQRYAGEWIITFPEDQRVISKPTLESAIDAAQVFIFSRDNTVDYSGFC